MRVVDPVSSGPQGRAQTERIGRRGIVAAAIVAALLGGAAAPATAAPAAPVEQPVAPDGPGVPGETPADPADPADPGVGEPGDSAGPVDSVDPAGPAEPVDPAEPGDDDAPDPETQPEEPAEEAPEEDEAVAAAAKPKLPFTDVGAKHQFRNQISWLSGTKISTGYADGSFKPGAKVSREAMAAFLERFDTGVGLPTPKYSQFKDVPTSHKFFREISWLSANGITTGYADGRFGPGGTVERQAMAAFLYRAAGKPKFKTPSTARFSDVPTTHKFFREVEWLASTGVTTGYSNGTFRPGAPVERQAMAAFLQRFEVKFFGGKAAAANESTEAVLSVSRSNESSVTVAWEPVDGAKSYSVEWSRSLGGELPTKQKVAASATGAKISGLRPGLGYSVRVVAAGTAHSIVAKTAALRPLNVASFNVVASKNPASPKDAWIDWSKRRKKVWSVGNSRRPDVVGMQEAGNNTVDIATGKPITVTPLKGDLPRFYTDVVRGWKAKNGTPYKLVNDKAWNCQNHASPGEPPTTQTRCKVTREDQGATHDVRIAYNPTTVKLLRSGGHQLAELPGTKLPTTHGGLYEKYIAWAEFEQLSTGKRFFFANVHLDNYQDKQGRYRKEAHTQEIIKQLPKLNKNHLPIVFVGDFSAQQWEPSYFSVIDPLKKAGYIDLLGSQPGTSSRANTGLGTAYVGRPNCNSANAFGKQYIVMGPQNTMPKCARTAITDLNHNGANVDYIFTKGVRDVPVWESMHDIDNNGWVQGTPPSDHVMLRAELLL